VLGQHAHVALDRVVFRILLLERRIPAAEGVVGESGDLAVEGRRKNRRMRPVPSKEVADGNACGQGKCACKRENPAAGAPLAARTRLGDALVHCGCGVVVTMSVHFLPAVDGWSGRIANWLLLETLLLERRG
jgi:hypothetical protein